MLHKTTLMLSLCLIPAATFAAPAGAPSRSEGAGAQILAQQQRTPATPRASTPRTFARGEVLPEAYRAKPVKNPYHQGLTPPKRTQQWVQVGRSFYLIDRANGEVADRVDP
ncbi:Ni/Co efflux regulator RcnB [Pseudochelatococcus lubricantis]|uniref:Ni/Co efflux regulator RcnB n=1 Tax=Pseudochelatococcus lubricantis TaxID=1538102 RepID=A0ABX0V7C0_9HYPH|nr:RcnB family protein [Pseudochelatococcus lubricantis]NIJ59680.1 Ni/Co efflux regulator RcnB [Pseudochelatococcus lubricantis]